jgi:hypothetical protein
MDKNICPDCWREHSGKCESIQERRERENQEAVKTAAKKLKKKK